MYTAHPQPSTTNRVYSYRENRSTGGLVAYLLVIPVLAAMLAAPAVVFGVAVGVLGLTLGRRLLRRLRRREGDGPSPSERSSRPA